MQIGAPALDSFAAQVDFGRTASDYRRHRAGFPAAFFDAVLDQLGLVAGQTVLDVGTGTGTIARGLARLGLDVTGVDPSIELIDQAAALGVEEGVSVRYRQGRAESLEFPDGCFDLYAAGQCWHWFDRPIAASEAFRVLRPGGRAIIAHFDWLPLPRNVVEATEALILEANPAWTGSGGTGIHPRWLADLANGGFTELTTRSFDVAVPYSHEAWLGRIRASAGVKASLGAEEVEAFDHKLARLIDAEFPQDPLLIPHRVWWVAGRRPEL